jgi:leucine dehydrogenase
VADRLSGDVVANEDVFSTACDIYAPCAVGATLNAETIPLLRCRIVAGCANNQLRELSDADRLRDAGILYAPDFVINAGGLINVYLELQGYDPELARSKARGIYDTLLAIFERAEADAIPTHRAAERLAEARIRDVGRAGRIWTPRRGVRPRRFADL